MFPRVTSPVRSATAAALVALLGTAVLAGCEGADPAPDRIAEPGADSSLATSPADTVLGPPQAEAPTRGAESTVTADLRTALEARMRGPSAGPGAGDAPSEPGDAAPSDAPSMFTRETADALRSVSVDSSGHATVDFHDLRPIIPNASSSAGSAVLLDELNAIVFRFPEIRSVEYRMEGSCDLFWEWLQYACQTVTRESTAP